MLFCDACDRGYHMECCRPPLTKPPKGNYRLGTALLLSDNLICSLLLISVNYCYFIASASRAK